MKRQRKWLSLVLGAVLLVQGFAVAAGPLGGLAAEQAVATEAAPPCHEPATDETPSSCCDADCPDMTSCMLGHFTTTPAFELAASPSPGETLRPIPARVLSRAPTSLLRPPISLHA